jgi:hypothetical protein
MLPQKTVGYFGRRNGATTKTKAEHGERNRPWTLANLTKVVGTKLTGSDIDVLPQRITKQVSQGGPTECRLELRHCTFGI